PLSPPTALSLHDALPICASADRRGPLPALVVDVEPAAGLLAEIAGGDEVLQDRGRAVLVVAEISLEHLGDREHGVEADEIGELRSEEHTSELQSPYDLVC